MENKKYFAFISYQSNDVEWAKWLEHELDFYHLPSNLDPNEKTLHGKKIRDNLRDVFWDSRLAAGGLDEGIKSKLECSANLIVICSPNSANVKEHPWVNEEIKYFIELGRLEHIFPFIVEGKNPKEFFPPALLNLPKDKERVGGNVNKDGKDAAFVKIAAGMLDVDVDILWQHYEREKAKLEREEREKKEKLQISQSQFLAEKANSLVEAGDSYTACLLALEALPRKEDKVPRPYVAEAEFALRYSLKRSQAILRGHGDWVFAVDISSDGIWIVSGSHDKTIRVWEKASGACLSVWKAHTGSINSLQIVPNSNYIVSAGDNSVKIWTLDGHLKDTLVGHQNGVNHVVVTSNCKYVFSASTDKTIKQWEIETSKCLKTFQGHKGFVKKVAVSNNDQLIASTAMDNTVQIWNIETGNVIQTIQITSPESAFFNADDTKIIISAYDGNVRIFDVTSGNLLQTIHVGVSLQSAIYSPMDKYILSADIDGNIKIWNSQDGELIKTLVGHTSPVDTIKFCPDGKSLISSARDKTLRIWEFNVKEKQKQPKRVFYTPPVVVSKAIFTSRKDIIASYWDKTLKLWNSDLTYCKRTFEGHTSMVTSFALSPDERLLASVSSDKTIRIWNLYSGKEEKRIWEPARELQSVAFSPDNKYLIASCDKIIKIWNTSNYELVRTLSGHTKTISFITFSEDGQYIISGSYDNLIKIWDVNNGELIRTLIGHFGVVNNIALCPQKKGILLASASSDATVRLWDGKTDKSLDTLDGHKNNVEYVSFSPDSRYLLSANTDIRVWDTETGVLVDVFDGHENTISSVVFSPDTKKILSASHDGTMKLWDFPPLQDLIDSTREKFQNRQLTKEERKKYYLE